MSKTHEEWFRQADYDLDTAQTLFDAGRHFYAVFMCHLSVEKALKGLYTAKRNEIPPKTHNLLFLREQIGLELSENMLDFVFMLNRVSVLTRYPEDLKALRREFVESTTRGILNESRELVQWLRAKLPRP